MVHLDGRDTAVRPDRAAPRRRTQRVPVALFVPAALGLAFLVLPLAGLVIRAPWNTLPHRLTAPGALVALRLSLQTATIATLCCLVLGVPLAWLLARVEFPGRRAVRALVTVPLVLPPVVGGVALLLVFGRNGLLGAWLHATFGASLPFTTAGVGLRRGCGRSGLLGACRQAALGAGLPVCAAGGVVAGAFAGTPSLVSAGQGGLRGAAPRCGQAAGTSGAGRAPALVRRARAA